MRPATVPTKQFDLLLRRTFFCPSCSKPKSAEPVQSRRKRQRTERYASTLSTTAINGSRAIPDRNQSLYQALTEVKSKASGYVNQSRLQLALQGLESEHPTTRIAILGLNVQDVARRITKLLLADALEDEHPWEKQILQQQGAHGLLIRHGQPQNTNIPQRTALPVLQIPSSILERLNVEILISSIGSEHGNTSEVPAEMFLAPAVGVPTAFDGRQVTVNYPVHQSIVVVQGFDELVNAIELLAVTRFHSQEDRNAVVLVANLPNSNTHSRGRVVVSDLARAQTGLDAIRQSTSKATTYEHEWLASGLPQLSDWLNSTLRAQSYSPSLALPVDKLISSLVSATATGIDHTISSTQREVSTSVIDMATRTRIDSAIEDFSRSAHQELQSGLASAWSSRNWKKLSWYKLFWRVDDVGLITSDLVTNTWLPKTERAVYEISGRLIQIGISPIMAESVVPETEHKTAFEPELAKPSLLDPASPVLATATTSPANELVLEQPREAIITSDTATNQPIVQIRPSPMPVPINAFISSARNTYLNQQITSLTSSAQQLVLRTLSISGLSAGLSALTYISTIAPTVYEAGSIFAVGTVVALYRMQSGWQHVTKSLETGLFEEGREVIRRVVQRMRGLVEAKAGEVIEGDDREMKILEEAQRAVQKARKALEELNVNVNASAQSESQSVGSKKRV